MDITIVCEDIFLIFVTTFSIQNVFLSLVAWRLTIILVWTIIAIPINMMIDTTSLGNVQITISEESVHYSTNCTASDGTWYNTIEMFSYAKARFSMHITLIYDMHM